MIKANELRIGNRLYKKGILVTVDGRSIMDIEYAADYAEHYFPISLSPEVLEKCGFEYEHDQSGMTFRKGNFYMSFDWNQTLSANFGHIEHLDVEVSYLHQLQNLFYCLVGTELNYTP